MKEKNMLYKLKTEYLGKGYAIFCGVLIVVMTIAIMGFIISKGMATFTKNGVSLGEFLLSPNWSPESETDPKYGALIFLVGSTLVSIGSVIISAPVAVALAIFMNIISPKLGKKVLQPAIELFVGIPSVVYGLIGVTVFVPFIRNTLGGTGSSLLTAIIILSIMILPTITSIAYDSIKVVSKDYIEASYGLGATRWQTIYKVVVPAAKSGILTGVVLGMARAFGEALAVSMVVGNAIKFAKTLTEPTSTLTGILTMDMTNTVSGTAWNDAIWSLAALLLIISFIFILIVRAIGKRGEMK